MQESGKKQFALPARARIKQKRVFDELFLKGQSIRQHPLRLTWIITPNGEEKQNTIRAGFSVPKRKFKHAVDRNLLKRRMREAYRLQAAALRTYCTENNLSVAVLFVYQSHEILPYNVMSDAVTVLTNKLIGRLGKAGIQAT